MMRSLNTVLMFFIVFLLAACQTLPPKPEVIESANYGIKPSKDLMLAAAKQFMSKRLIDPYSAIYSCSTPVKSWAIGGMGGGENVKFGRTYFGYASVCTINAKNEFGGYTGNEEYLFMISELEQNGQHYFRYFAGREALETVPE